MTEQEKEKALIYFQANAFKTYKTLGFHADNANVIFGIIIEMRNMVTAAEREDTIILHKHMGIGASYVANYATINSIKLSDVLADITHEELELITEGVDLEEYLQKIKDDLSFARDMKESDKIQFIQKCWTSIFPDHYHDNFLKVERLLSLNIEDNKIKFPKQFI